MAWKNVPKLYRWSQKVECFHFYIFHKNYVFNRLLKLPKTTLVYPAHDYNGKKYSTIETEINNNPRLQVNSAEQYAEIMNNLNLSNPTMMDIAVAANVKGFTLDKL